jgi:NADH dehydrogenase/NADH:ubiquinone oxidoreductase subunit G
MNNVTLEINGKQVVAEEGNTLLEAARKAGLEIPTLCSSSQVKPSGACRMCMVEVTKGTRKRLVASCIYQVEQGIKVATETERITKLRRLILELLWPTSEGLARKFGLTGSRFEPELFDCNLCGLCVRTCTEVTKKNVAHFQGRGIDRRVALVPGMEDECASCRQCFDLCRGGFIVTSSAESARIPWRGLRPAPGSYHGDAPQ